MDRYLILDIDDTLLKVDESQCETFKDPVQWPKNSPPWYVSVRPSTFEFLERTKHFKTICLTQGIIEWQKEVFKVTGIDKYIPPEEIYGWTAGDDENINWLTFQREKTHLPNLPPGAKFCMIDNHNYRNMLTWQKANWLGVKFNESNFITCSAYSWGYETSSLLELIPRIEEILK